DAGRLRDRVLAPALARAPAEVGLERCAAQQLVARLAAAAGAFDSQGLREHGDADERVVVVEIDEREAAPAVALQLELIEAEDEQATGQRQAGDPRRGCLHER